jgi:hypothetical protein
MRPIGLFIVISSFLCLSLSSCRKDTNPDLIDYSELNHLLIAPGSDTLFKHIFELLPNRNPDSVENPYNAILRFYYSDMLDDIGCQFLKTTETGNALILLDGAEISGGKKWDISFPEGSLLVTRGAGPQFLGFRFIFSSSWPPEYHYGWLRLQLSAAGDTLRLIDFATNATAGKGIRAGQMD